MHVTLVSVAFHAPLHHIVLADDGRDALLSEHIHRHLVDLIHGGAGESANLPRTDLSLLRVHRHLLPLRRPGFTARLPRLTALPVVSEAVLALVALHYLASSADRARLHVSLAHQLRGWMLPRSIRLVAGAARPLLPLHELSGRLALDHGMHEVDLVLWLLDGGDLRSAGRVSVHLQVGL